MSNNEIENEFLSHPKKQYVTGFNISECHSDEQIVRIEKYHYFDIANKNLRDGINFLFNVLFDLNIAKKHKFYKSHSKIWKIYCGSDYWSLTYNCAQFLYEQCIAQKGLMNYLKTAFVPSEIFVQTILLNSKYSEQCDVYPNKKYTNLASLTPMQYIDYRPTGMEVLDESSYEDIIASKKIFFRKASSKVSSGLITMINDYRRNH